MRLKHFTLILAFAPFLLRGQDFKDLEKRVTEFTLSNGLHFIVLERHEAPVVSFHTYVNAGAVDDPSGETGLAHMFEHMAFKGTTTIGTKNYPAEKKALDEVERIYNRLDAERDLAFRADPAKIASLEKELKQAIDKANTYVEPNMYPRIIEENGGVGMNANTGVDATQYFYSLPANRIELWFLLESDRLLHPVFREFYKERDVVREERRMRIESNPQGKLMEALLAAAFEAHPYRDSPAGWASDIENLRAPEARQFFKTYYVPSNIAMGIAGDVKPAEIKRLAEKYFAALPAGPNPPLLHTIEPPQPGEKNVEVDSPSQPIVALVYKRPDQRDPDDPVFDVISDILSGGRTAMLYQAMVRDKKIAVAAESAAAYPAGKYPSLFVLLLVPAMGHSGQENEKACYEVLERLKDEKVDQATLERVKTKLRASVIRGLDSNSGMASQLTWYYVNYGNWKKLFTALDDINKVTADDVQRVARKYFIEASRTVAYTVEPKEEAK
jgi:predicted Zn-dependent peptidase